MLQSLSGVAPRSVYVCGNTTTTSGLTVCILNFGASLMVHQCIKNKANFLQLTTVTK